jgi:CubicO group peptidase (beta-lactamase class C family)
MLEQRDSSLLILALLALGPAAAVAQRFDVVDSVIAAGIRQGIYPGAVVVIGRRDTVLYARGYGHYTWSRASPVPSPDSTLWDLASLTKVVATTSAIMRLVEQGRLTLDRPVAAYLPRFTGPGKERVTVRMLLDHTSGLPSYVEYFRLAPTRDSAVALLYREPLRRPPGQSAVYSDLNFLLLGLLVEQVSGESLDRFAAREIFLPAGMHDTRFRPPSGLAPRIAPTGRWHGRPVAGVVSDRNALRFGGVAGHAGLFATASDLARYARLWLNGGSLDGRRVLAAETVRSFLAPTGRRATRLLGWERPDPDDRRDTHFGRLVSEAAYGHTGWTGTELWIDPARDLFVVFLTNRSYGARADHSISRLRAVRGDLADAVVRAVPGACEAVPAPAC